MINKIILLIKHISSTTVLYLVIVMNRRRLICTHQPTGASLMAPLAITANEMLPLNILRSFTAVQHAIPFLLQMGISRLPQFVVCTRSTHNFFLEGRYCLEFRSHETYILVSLRIWDAFCPRPCGGEDVRTLSFGVPYSNIFRTSHLSLSPMLLKLRSPGNVK